MERLLCRHPDDVMMTWCWVSVCIGRYQRRWPRWSDYFPVIFRTWWWRSNDKVMTWKWPMAVSLHWHVSEEVSNRLWSTCALVIFDDVVMTWWWRLFVCSGTSQRSLLSCNLWWRSDDVVMTWWWRDDDCLCVVARLRGAYFPVTFNDEVMT